VRPKLLPVSVGKFILFILFSFLYTRSACFPLFSFPTGEAVLEQYDLGTANPREDMAVLVCMGIIYRIIFFLILQFVHKGKR